MRDDETNATILSGGKLDSNGALACKEEPLHSWVPGSNHELDRQQRRQVSLVPTAVYSEVKRKPQRNRNRKTVIVIVIQEM